MLNKPVILIPAYKPDWRLIELVNALSATPEQVIVIVDDGSGSEYREIFAELDFMYGCHIVTHEENRGKGTALKTGIRYALLMQSNNAGIVTADADGQHAPEDILRVVESLTAETDALVLGARNFSGEHVPFKSRWGNRITSAVFGLTTGTRCRDTQTGLRGVPADFAKTCLEIPGDRFEYEFNVLLRAAKDKIPLSEVQIQTIYLDENRSSHFRAVKDSVRIYGNFLKFGASSLCSALLDLSLFTVLTNALFGGTAMGILYATVLARLLSGVFNFTLNKRWVFQQKRGYSMELIGYLALFFGQMLASSLLVSTLSALLPQLTVVKMLVDTGLFLLSYFVQKNIIFHPQNENGSSNGKAGITR